MKTHKRISGNYWECVCGKKAMPLTDETKCKCNDIYEQSWFYMPKGRAELLKERAELAAIKAEGS